MQSSNSVEGNGHGVLPSHEKTPEEIQLEIARTRSAITGDLVALSEKLSPAHLRESAREVMRDAREEAKEVLREAKDAAIDSLRGVKTRAIESVNETVHDLTLRTREVGGTALAYASAHPTALSLVGLGAGVLVWIFRERSRRREPQYANEYEFTGYGNTSERFQQPPRNVRHAVQPGRRGAAAPQSASGHAGGGNLAVWGLVAAAGFGIALLWPLEKRRVVR
jgi:ElaB/YqjD/DUF883 family membrane-anchored ribosome-binding protein